MNGRRAVLRQQIQRWNVHTALSALDALDAAFSLFASGRITQAVFLFHHSIELAMKGLLDEIHPILTAARPDYEALKWIAREQIEKHRLAPAVQVPDDLAYHESKRTCTFDEALDRIGEMLRLSKETKSPLKEFNQLRNRIVHYGNKGVDDIACVEGVLMKAWPFMKFFYNKAYEGADISMVLRTEEENREIEVASKYMKCVLSNPSLPFGKILHTFDCAFHRDIIVGPGYLLYDEEGIGIDISEQRYGIYSRAHSSWDGRWDMVVDPGILKCRICGSNELIVSLDERILYDPRCGFRVRAIKCMECSLFLSPTYEVLSQLHYGEITKATVDDAVWSKLIEWLRDYGSSLKYDPAIIG